MEYLHIPKRTFWQSDQEGTQHVVVQAPAGKVVQVVVEVQG